MSRRITLVSVDAGPGHNCGLAIGLKKYGAVTTVWENRNLHGLDFLVPDAKYGYRNIPPRGDDLIIVGCVTFNRLTIQESRMWNRLKYGRVHVIVTDGHFARNPDHYNREFEGMDVITTACKRHFREPLPVKTYYQPLDLLRFFSKKNIELTIGHSPFGPKKRQEKGTDLIEEATEGYNFDLITGVSWRECLERKSKCHIFVDQVSHYDRDKFKLREGYTWPALGKSGVEAMHLGCLVITYGKAYDTEIPAPPIAWVTEDTFKDTLDYYIHNRNARNKLAREGRKWALQYASYDYAARTVLQ